MSRRVLSLLPSLLLAACQAPAPPSAPGGHLDGAWNLVAIRDSTDTATTTLTPQENLFLFAGTYYSMAYAVGEQRTPYYATRFNPTDAESLARMNSMTVNAGTVEMEGSRMTLHPLVARVPEFVGGRAEFDWALSGDTLTLHWLRTVSADGVEGAGGVTILTLVRLP